MKMGWIKNVRRSCKFDLTFVSIHVVWIFARSVILQTASPNTSMGGGGMFIIDLFKVKSGMKKEQDFCRLFCPHDPAAIFAATDILTRSIPNPHLWILAMFFPSFPFVIIRANTLLQLVGEVRVFTHCRLRRLLLTG